ncbi:MAG: PadR family transcriptional regulator [Methanobacteriota archaeon]
MSDAIQRLQAGLLEAFVLDSLAREAKHGYALLKEMEAVFGAAPARNRLYPMLARLESGGFIVASEAEGGTRDRTTFVLSGKGLARLRDYKVLPGAFREKVLDFWGEPLPEALPRRKSAAAESAPRPVEARPERVTVTAPADLASVFERGLGCREAALSLVRGKDGKRLEIGFVDCDFGNRPGCPGCPVTRLVASAKDSYF